METGENLENTPSVKTTERVIKQVKFVPSGGFRVRRKISNQRTISDVNHFNQRNKHKVDLSLTHSFVMAFNPDNQP
jgi:hypothetical protein